MQLQPLATMVTMTTYGTWLRGDERGWVEDGVVYLANPQRESDDRHRMKHVEFRFVANDLLRVGEWIGRALIARLDQRILATTVHEWHAHFVVGPSRVDAARIVKCAKDAVRYGLRPNRPIWTAGYDKRYCLDSESVRTRVKYVERHNTERGWSARPWEFIEVLPDLW
jgi:hypothetical protein